MTMRETSSARLSRLLALIPWLEQHDGVSISEAAIHFGITPAELEADLWLTICCGLPGHGPDQLIDIQFWDDDGRICVQDVQNLDRPLRFTVTESTALLVGLRLLAQVPGDHDRAALASVTAKLEQAAGRVDDSPAVLVDEVEQSVVECVTNAITSGTVVRILYAGASRDEVTDRVVEPGEVVVYQGRQYLIGWCREAHAQRTFRLDRIRAITLLEETATPVTTQRSIVPMDGMRVRVRVHPRSRWFLEIFETDDLSPELPHGRDATLTVADPTWLVRLVIGQAGGVEVLEPAGVRAQVRLAAEAALARLDALPF